MDPYKGSDNPGFVLNESKAVQQPNKDIDSVKDIESGGAFEDGVRHRKCVEEFNEDSKKNVCEFEAKVKEENFAGDVIEKYFSWVALEGVLVNIWKWRFTKLIVLSVIFILYNIYFIGAIYYNRVNSDTHLDYCNDVGFLIILTIFVYLGMFYFLVFKRFFSAKIYKSVVKPLKVHSDKILSYRHSGLIISVLLIGLILLFIIVDSLPNEPRRLVSAFGAFMLIFLGLVFSKHPSYVVWRHVIWGLALQFFFALIILRWDVGQGVFDCLGKKVKTFLDYTDAGSGFVFGYLVTQQPFNPGTLSGVAQNVTAEINSTPFAINFVFTFKILSIIYFFSFFVSMLFYWGTMQWVVTKLGWLLQVSVGTTACESLNAAGNIFLGQSESPLMIRPYLPIMTNSEIHAVMTGGFATIAGSVLGAYIGFGISASHLLSASVMSAPAALAYAKLFYPETKKSKTKADDIDFDKNSTEDSNVIDAAANGAVQAVVLVGNIVGSLIAFLAFVAFMNGLLSWFGGLVGAPFITFEWLLGWIFYPLAWLMGIDCMDHPEREEEFRDDCRNVAVLVGLKSIVNEFAAYERLGMFKKLGQLAARSEYIATYALCGFANPASIGVQIAALSYMAPSRRGDVTSVAMRAYIAGSAACFLTACIAGALLKEEIDI